MSEKVNLKPDSFAEGGGLIDDFDGEIQDIRFIMTDYDGKIANQIPAARLMFVIDDEAVDPTLYSVGGKDEFAPDETGMSLVKLKSKSTLTKTAKFSMFLASLVKAGFPLNRMDSENIGYLAGLKGHFLREVVTYSGLKKKEGDREDTVLLCTKIHQLPGEDVKKGKKGASKGLNAAVSVEIANAVIGIVQGILAENGGEVAKKDLLTALFKSADVKALTDKKGALKLASNDTWLSERDEWSYEDGVLKYEFGE